jgi:hypothetical protein
VSVIKPTHRHKQNKKAAQMHKKKLYKAKQKTYKNLRGLKKKH